MNINEQKAWEMAYRKNEAIAIHGRFSFKKKLNENKSWNSVDKLLSTFKITKKTKILDAGCGSLGRIVVPVAKRGFKVTGIDISNIAIELLEKRIRKLHIQNKCNLCVGDIQSLPFESESFDIVISTNTMNHFFSLDKVISELSRVTKKQGFLYLDNFKNYDTSWRIVFAISTFLENIFDKNEKIRIKTHLHKFVEIQKEFEKNNLKIIKISSVIGFMPFYVNFSEKIQNKYFWKNFDGFVSNAHTWSFLLQKFNGHKTRS